MKTIDNPLLNVSSGGGGDIRVALKTDGADSAQYAYVAPGEPFEEESEAVL
jgi:hypothetical protein